MKRIAIGGMSHESNTLNPIITGADDFAIYSGGDIEQHALLPDYSITGIVRTLRSASYEIVPLVVARAVPNGVVSGQLYAEIKNEFIARSKAALRAGKIDGVCLALHGSMKVEDGKGASMCAEGDLLKALREVFPDVPVTASLDMHATITKDMLDTVNGFAGYKTAPHIDCAETGELAAKLLIHTLTTGDTLFTEYRRIPMLIAGEKSESEAEPMKSLIGLLHRAEKEAGVLAASYLLGFPWADHELSAASALVTGTDYGKVKQAADDLAAAFWAKRAEFRFRNENYSSAEALDAAYRAVLDLGERPVFLSDSGDNPTAGAAGDATELFECVLSTLDTANRLPTPLLYSGFYDKAATLACVNAGEGAVLDLTVGGNWDTLNGKKIPLRVAVLKTVQNYGPYRASLALVSYANLRIVLTSKHIGFGDENLLPALGVNAADYALVVVKLGYLEDCFRSIAKRAILALSKGCSNEALETIPYRRINRPLYPLDKMDE